jgi:hypothetical protein
MDAAVFALTRLGIGALGCKKPIRDPERCQAAISEPPLMRVVRQFCGFGRYWHVGMLARIRRKYE